MDNISLIVAANLKRLREERKLSLDSVARASGVSKSMLGQMERGEVNPTISTIWKIANGLKLSFTELLNHPESEHEIMDIRQIDPLIENGGRFRNYPVFPFDSKRRFEVYTIEIDPEGSLSADPHPAGTQEFITLFSGTLTVRAGEENFTIGTGCSLRFRADLHHGYANTGLETCRMSMIIYYPQQG